MTVYSRRRPHRTSRPTEPPIIIRMDGSRVVIRTAGPLDDDATVTLADAIGVAVAAGSIAVLVLAEDAGFHLTAPVPPARSARRSSQLGPVAIALGPGLLRIPTASASWTVDVAAGALCHGLGPTDREPVSDSPWRDVPEISISPHAVAAVTDDGRHIVAARHCDRRRTAC